MTVDAPTVGRRRIDPGAAVTVNLSATILDDAKDVRLVVAIPLGWTVAGTGGGTLDPAGDTVTWEVGDVPADTRFADTLRLRAPGRSPSGVPAYDTTFQSRLEHADGILDTASARLLVAPEIVVEHVTFAVIDDASHEPTYLLPTSRWAASVGSIFRVRFQVRNADLVPTLLTPRLQFKVVGAPDFGDVPNNGPVAGVPFYFGTEWRPVAGGRGMLPGPAEEGIAASDLRERDRDDDTQAPIGGTRLMQASSARTFRLSADAYTEIEFTVRSSLDLPFNQGFELRLVDGGQPIPGAVSAVVRSGSRPPIVLSAGQRDGIYVGPPVDSGRSSPRGMASVEFPLVAPGVIAATWSGASKLPVYRLAVAFPTTPLAQAPLNATFTSPHTTQRFARLGHVRRVSPRTQPAAATCSRPISRRRRCASPATTPRARARTSTSRARSRLPLRTFPARGSTTATTSSPTRTSNARAATTRTTQRRRTATQTTTGWTVAGAQSTVAGVVVTNRAAGTTPTYAVKDGTFGNQPTREYEICLKCHTGAAVASNAGQPPSRFQLDKGIELNPANYSYHPVEGAGRNTTAAMALSLAGTRPTSNGTSRRTAPCGASTATRTRRSTVRRPHRRPARTWRHTAASTAGS